MPVDQKEGGRRVPRSTPAADPVAAAVHVIDPNGVYSAQDFRIIFGLRASSLRREVRQGRLEVYKRCGRYFILGEQILAWLRGGEMKRGPGRYGEVEETVH